jgi:hypothetical protein
MSRESDLSIKTAAHELAWFDQDDLEDNFPRRRADLHGWPRPTDHPRKPGCVQTCAHDFAPQTANGCVMFARKNTPQNSWSSL